MECVKGRPQPFGVEIRKDHINFAVEVPTGKKCELLLYKKGSMKLIHVGDVVKEVYEITGFTDILTIE